VNRDRIPVDWSIMLTDTSGAMLEATSHALESSGLDVAFRQVSAEGIPFDANAFDCVIANHMLYHVEDHQRAIGEIRRVLKPGGLLYAATNGRDHMRELDDLIRPIVPDLMRPNMADSFGLENGEGQLLPWFSSIVLSVYPDALRVTEPEPLISYVLSMSSMATVTDRQQSLIEEAIRSRIGLHGVIEISKSVGLFSCRAPA
jgi:SAM-dependent methyltransferase